MKNFKDYITEDTYEEALSQIKKEKAFSGYKITPKYKFSFRGKTEAGIAVHVPFLKEPVVFVEDSPEGSEVQAGGKRVGLPSRWSVWMNKTINMLKKLVQILPLKLEIWDGVQKKKIELLNPFFNMLEVKSKECKRESEQRNLSW